MQTGIPAPQASVGFASQPTMRFIGNREINERDTFAETQNKPAILSLASHLRRLWEEAKRAKEEVEREILEDYRQRNGQYDSKTLASIEAQGGSVLFVMITNVKCRAAEAWIRDVLQPADDRPWGLKPTPIPELPEQHEQGIVEQVFDEAQRYADHVGMPVHPPALNARADQLRDLMLEDLKKTAKEEAKKAEEEIADMFTEGGFDKAFRGQVRDIVTTKAGFLKGPIVRRKLVLKWEDGPNGPVAKVNHELIEEYERVSPLDIYPSADAIDIQDGYLFEREQYSRSDLQAMRGVPGYNIEAINTVLSENLISGVKDRLSVDQERDNLESRKTQLTGITTIEGLSFWGDVSGKLLLEWGMSPAEISEPDDDYTISAILSGNHVLKAVLNEDPLNRRPYSKACFEEVPGSFWGRGIAELMKDCQTVCNATARALVNNLSISSGPQVAINDVSRLPLGETITGMKPWKVWQFTAPKAGDTRPPIEFFQPASNANELLAVYEKFSSIADDVTGVPAYTYGDSASSGAGKTASGLSMLISQATRGIKHVIANIDSGTYEPTVQRSFDHWLLFKAKHYIGDVKTQARGSANLINKEQQQIRRTEFLQMTLNPVDQQIIGLEGRAVLLRENIKALDMPSTDIIPDNEELAIRLSQPPMMDQQQPGQDGRPAELDPSGNPVSGQDAALFQRQARQGPSS